MNMIQDYNEKQQLKAKKVLLSNWLILSTAENKNVSVDTSQY